MNAIARIGLDIAKDVFQVHAVNDRGEVVLRRRLRRAEVIDYFGAIESTLIGMESCATSQYWARTLMSLGHRVRLIPISFVRPFVKSQKNDLADAEAICDAVGQPNMRFAAVKTEEQQAILVIHRVRELLVRQRTMLINALRAHVAEFGRIAAHGRSGAEELVELAEADQLVFVPPAAHRALKVLAKEIRNITRIAKGLEDRIVAWHRSNARSRRLATMPGIGPLTASAIAATVPDARLFKSGQALAAWLGLVPRQHSSGGKTKLGRITKRGDAYIRKLLVIGARAALASYKRGFTRLPRSVVQLVKRKHFKIVLVALANRMARLAWVLLTRGEDYRPPPDHQLVSAPA